jgi:hypothetical protein
LIFSWGFSFFFFSCSNVLCTDWNPDMICCILFPTMGEREREREGVFFLSHFGPPNSRVHTWERKMFIANWHLQQLTFSCVCVCLSLSCAAFFSSHSINKGVYVCVTLTLALPFTFKKYLKARKKKLFAWWNSNIWPCKNMILEKKSSKRNPKSFKIIITLS